VEFGENFGWVKGMVILGGKMDIMEEKIDFILIEQL